MPDQTTKSDRLPFEPITDLAAISMVDLASHLESVTVWIEQQRVREREARRAYEAVAAEVQERIGQIRDYAARLVAEHRRRISSFDGMVEQPPLPPLPELKPEAGLLPRPRTIEDAILAIWSLDRYDEPLTTEQIARALPEVGYESKAAPRSLRSTVNQALARLCRDGRIHKFRMDGSPLPDDQPDARARRYQPG